MHGNCSKVIPKKYIKKIISFLCKCIYKSKTFLFFLLALTFVAVIRLLKPFVVIRVGFTDIGRIGGVYNADWYLSEVKAGLYKKGKYLDVFYFQKSTGMVCNYAWLKIWKRVLRVLPLYDAIINIADRVNRILINFEDHIIPDRYCNYPSDKELALAPNYIEQMNNRLKCIIKNDKPNIFLTEEEEELGRKGLISLGIEDGCGYICFSNRDSAYLDKIYPDRDWTYHDYRNSSIHNYLMAAEKMTEKGYYSIRVGSIFKEKIKTDNPKVINYSSSDKRTELLDIYLGAKCKFSICPDGGISIIPEMFRVPVVYTNWTAITRISLWVINGIYIFKKFYMKSEKRFLTFKEIMKLDFGGTDTNEKFAKWDIKPIENTPGEILDVTIEMDERLNGDWIETEEDIKLQKMFWAFFGDNLVKSTDLRIGANYLKQNKDLLK